MLIFTESCDIYGVVYNEPYSMAGDFKCGKCQEVSGNVIKIIAISIWTLLSMAFAVKSSISMIRTIVMISCFYKMGIYFGGKTQRGN